MSEESVKTERRQIRCWWCHGLRWVNKPTDFSNKCELVGFLLLTFLLTLYVLSVLSFIINIPLSSKIMLMGFGIMLLSLGAYHSSFSSKIISYLVSIFIILILGHLFWNIWDLSWDGNAYHGFGIYKMSYEQFNPYRNYDNGPIGGYWFYYYGKAQEIVSSVLALFFGSLESGKSSITILAISSFLLTFSFFKKISLNVEVLTKNKALIFIAALGLSFNPVVISQLFTNYVDAQLYLMCEIIAVLVGYAIFLKDNAFVRTLIFFSIVYAMNIKGSALLFVPVILTSLFILTLITHRFNLRLTIIVALAVIAGVCLFGFTPYMYNLIEHGNIIYPLNHSDIMTMNTPPYFLYHNRFYNVLVSILAAPNNLMSNNLQDILSYNSYNNFYHYFLFAGYDLRVGGWGSFFPILMVLSLAVFIKFMVGQNSRKMKCILLLFLLTLVTLTFATKQGWWARYNPYIYTLPMIAVLISDNLKTISFTIIKILLCFFVLLNIISTTVGTIQTQYYNQVGSYLALDKNHDYEFSFSKSQWIYFKEKLDRLKLHYKTNDSLDCDKNKKFWYVCYKDLGEYKHQ